MPNLANAKKALRQSERAERRNNLVRNEIATLRRSLRKLLEGKKVDEAKKMVPELDKKLDKAVTKRVFKKNTVARIKSRAAAAVARAAK